MSETTNIVDTPAAKEAFLADVPVAAETKVMPVQETERGYTEEDLKNVNIEEWIKRTEGMSLSHLKEVVISTIVMGREFEEVMDNLEGLKKAPTIKGSGKVGFNR